MNVLNLTPHDVTIIFNDGQTRETIPPEPRAARVESRQLSILPGGSRAPAMLQGAGYPAVVMEDYVDPPLPPPRPGVWLLVSKAVFNSMPDRRDLIHPTSVFKQPDGSLACRAFRRRP